jgi:hypothetical protein
MNSPHADHTTALCRFSSHGSFSTSTPDRRACPGANADRFFHSGMPAMGLENDSNERIAMALRRY